MAQCRDCRELDMCGDMRARVNEKGRRNRSTSRVHVGAIDLFPVHKTHLQAVGPSMAGPVCSTLLSPFLWTALTRCPPTSSCNDSSEKAADSEYLYRLLNRLRDTECGFCDLCRKRLPARCLLTGNCETISSQISNFG